MPSFTRVLSRITKREGKGDLYLIKRKIAINGNESDKVNCIKYSPKVPTVFVYVKNQFHHCLAFHESVIV